MRQLPLDLDLPRGHSSVKPPVWHSMAVCVEEVQVLSELVSLAGRRGSRLALIGISNTHDLTLRHLPLLAAAKVSTLKKTV